MSFRHLRNARGFFSDYYLGSIFGRGQGRGRKRKLSDRDTFVAYRRLLRTRELAEGKAPDAATCRERFARPLLRDVLGYHLGAGEERIHALFSSAQAEEQKAIPLLLAYCGGWDEDLDAGGGERRATKRIEAALAHQGVRYGLLVTGECLRLVRAPGEGPSGAYLEIDLAGLCEDDDPDSFAAAWLLLRAENFTPTAEGRGSIEIVEKESREHASKVSDDLKEAVFRAAEFLVAGLVEDAVARGEVTDPCDLTEAELRSFRDTALLALYRILFILYAEARDTRLSENAIYWKSYSAHRLLEEILEEPSHAWPENRSSLWLRLVALFRIYDKGFPAITPYEHIPPRGGEFFSSVTPEGRRLESARLSDRTVARLLVDLATTTPRRGIGRERVSFRELDIEQLGHVYEGLLAYEPRVASEPTIELKVKGQTYALAVPEMVRLCREKSLVLKGEFELVAGTTAEDLHPDSIDEEQDGELAEIEGGKHEKGIAKGDSARLIRRLDRGSFHFVPGAARKGSGSFYTPLALVRDVIRHALGPMVVGKKPEEIEALRVLDPACGSAHFLVEAMRFLGKALHRAYVEAHGAKGPPAFRSTIAQGWDDHWQASDDEARAANSEARAWCKRRIAERCLFGIDMNPTAVSLARVALWIESLAGDRPLTYFEHHVRVGNSLLGSWMKRLEKPPLPSMSAAEKKVEKNLYEVEGLWQQTVRKTVIEAARIRRLIDSSPAEALSREGIDPESVEELTFKEAQRRKAQGMLAAAHLLFDLRSASAFVPAIWGDWATLCSYVDSPKEIERYARSRKWWSEFESVRERERFFHWELEFPEVLLDKAHRGFDVVLGNPPWDRLKPDSKEFYGRYDVLIRAYAGNDLDRRIGEIHKLIPGSQAAFAEYADRIKTTAHLLRRSGDFPHSKARSHNANEELSKYFIDRSLRLIGEGGAIGMIVPSVVYNGDGCLGLRRFLLEGGRIERFYAFENKRKIFPIHSSYKFVSLVFRKGAAADGFDAAFMRHDLAELEQEGPKHWMVRMRTTEIIGLSPDSIAFLEFRSARDADIARRMHQGQLRLADVMPGSWGATLFSWRSHMNVFHTTNDKDLFTRPETRRLYTSSEVLGHSDINMGGESDRMRASGFLPVFEGKSVDQFLIGTKPIRWWLNVEQAKQKYGKPPREEPTLMFRETARNTDERTCIAGVLPVRSAASHTLTGVLCGSVEPEAAASVLNSLCFDYALRLRTAGTHVSFTYMHPMPVPPAHVTNALPRVPTLASWDANIEHITDREDLWPALWSANRAVAEAYGLSPDDFDHILSSFPGMAKKRKPFVAYLRTRLAEWKQQAGVIRDGEAWAYEPIDFSQTASRAAEGPIDAQGPPRQGVEHD